MRIDQRIVQQHGLTARQHFFCECWFNLVHEASLDAFRVRAMNPLNIVRELLKMVDGGHANESDVGRVTAEAVEILSDPIIMSDDAFRVSASHLVSILTDAKPKQGGQDADESKALKTWGAALARHHSLIDAFGRELEKALDDHFVARCVSWLERELSVQGDPPELENIETKLGEIENVTSTLLSTLINRGWSFESLFMLYRLMLLPNVEKAAAAPAYVFSEALDAVFQRLGAQPKPYRVTFSISNVSKPDHFPARVGDIEFTTQPPEIGPNSSNYVRRYASARGGRLFATTTAHAQDGRMAGSVASDRIGQVLDVVRYDYERKNVQLSNSFLLAKEDRHMLLPLPGTVPNPDSSLTAEQLEEFMRRLQELVGSGTLSADAKDRIYSTFRLYRVGAETSNFENKLVNWWTAVEFLVKGIGSGGGGIGDGVENSLAPTVAMSYLPKHLAALRSALVDLKIDLRNAADEPLELGRMGLSAFYTLLQDATMKRAVEDACRAHPFIWFRTRRFLAMLATHQKVADALNNHERRLRWHVQRIYRARCDIVHSAQRVVDATLLCANLEFYLKTVLSAFLDAFHRHPTLRSPREFFDRQQHALGQITKELKANQNVSLTALLASRDAAASLP
ncbi:hypothetical protein R69746_08038 [Paraburkholderia aspalathi]|uniref:hypothetical protein n=1 Tax=Paraburkholderia aspalathi TaxID=1324617 RepID=UPI00190E4CB3|nr:hypothetical protein [Paraburkholderia aspalathi]MBK3844001.1 hypothetical protein [Paraburkholderia aspalathi]CAE6865004.1 hypothetical protein R69746_08038 [Paraburkholderia aspalathi]CAE6867909.1 hypothetical protein R75465_08090 [Paraburkholderia aspalathi]